MANAICPTRPDLESPETAYSVADPVLRAVGLIENGSMAEAELCLKQAYLLTPDAPDVHFALGLFEEKSGDLHSAQRHYERVTQLDPCHARAYVNLGLLHKQADALDKTEDCYRRATTADPAMAEAHLNLGTLLHQTNRPDEAEKSFLQALANEPTMAAAHLNLSMMMLWQSRIPEALQFALKALQLAPRIAEVHNALGAIYKSTQQIAKAVERFRQAVDREPSNAGYHANLAGALVDARQLDEASEQFSQAIGLNTDLPDANYGLGMLQLLEGNFTSGWKKYEWRWRSTKDIRRHQSKPDWDGIPAPDRTLLVHCEQGLGDSIQFARYMPLLSAKVGTLILECPPEAKALFETLTGLANVVTPYDSTPDHDLQIPLLSLPRIFNTTLENIPNQTPYLQAPENRQPPALSLPTGKLNVGLAWAGNPHHRNDAFRSMQWPDCQSLLKSDRAHFVSLQLNT
ncbi:MAG TPA: tetratricopeptide repeat protein, partial [Verrucomicrobiota bacterium]|nr:tetratricopeptide repeat protein [Verrucomicrobiota bacterium]